MTLQQILDRLSHPGVAVDRLLDEVRAPDLTVWREHPELYPAFVQRLLERGHPGRALDLGREGEQHLRNSSRLQYLLALAAARGGSARYAEALLAPLLAKATGPDETRPADLNDVLRVDVIALQGRLFKDRSEREPALAAESAKWYERAAAVAGSADPTFPLINAATMWRVADDTPRSETLARKVVALIGDRAKSAAADGNLWPAATLGEAFLLLGEHDEAIKWYRLAVQVATGRGEIGNLISLRNNIRLLKSAGATADPAFLDEHLGKVVVFSGHLLDSPERLAGGAAPRFPRNAHLEAAVAAAIRASLEALNARVGFCSLGCGGDILFAEAILARGGELHVVLPFAQPDFCLTSVDFGQDGVEWQDWRERFERILKRVGEGSGSQLHQLTQEPYLGSSDLFGTANVVLQGLAVLRARERASEPIALVLLDKTQFGQSGGTADFLTVWATTEATVEEIDLTALRAAVAEVPTPQEEPAKPPVTSTLPRPVKAMLFADVAGYSGIPEGRLPDFLTAYGDFLRALFGSAVGLAAVYANTWGDGLYVVFDTVADAAAFAVELVEPSGGPVPDWVAFGLGPTNPMRVGLHTGPVFELKDLFQGRSEFAGQHVTRAARIEPVTVRGCAYASEPFAALLAMRAGGRFIVETVGVHSLAKDYDRCALYRVQKGVGGAAATR